MNVIKVYLQKTAFDLEQEVSSEPKAGGSVFSLTFSNVRVCLLMEKKGLHSSTFKFLLLSMFT